MRFILITISIIILSGCVQHKTRDQMMSDHYVLTCNSLYPGDEEGAAKCYLQAMGAYAKELEKEQSRQMQSTSNVSSGVYNQNHGTTVYSRDECIGPVIMGECKGTISPKGGYHKTCHGTMLNGTCTGPMF